MWPVAPYDALAPYVGPARLMAKTALCRVRDRPARVMRPFRARVMDGPTRAAGVLCLRRARWGPVNRAPRGGVLMQHLAAETLGQGPETPPDGAKHSARASTAGATKTRAVRPLVASQRRASRRWSAPCAPQTQEGARPVNPGRAPTISSACDASACASSAPARRAAPPPARPRRACRRARTRPHLARRARGEKPVQSHASPPRTIAAPGRITGRRRALG